jgi:hypothetical protein
MSLLCGAFYKRLFRSSKLKMALELYKVCVEQDFYNVISIDK